MQERGERALEDAKNEEAKRIRNEWIDGGWEKLESFCEAGINPDATLISLFDNFGGKGRLFTKHMEKRKISYKDQQTVWGLFTLFQNNVGEDLKIRDFTGITSEQIREMGNYSNFEVRILERLFTPLQHAP